MPPQPGVFALPYASIHKPSSTNDAEMFHHTQSYHLNQPPSSSVNKIHDESRKERKRKDLTGKLGKEMSDRKDDGRHYSEQIASLHNTAVQLATQPSSVSTYNLRLYSISLERSALLAQFALEEKYALDIAQMAFEEERERVEVEWRQGHERIRDRLLEGIDERRRRAREEKEGEGTVGDASLDSQSRPHITRKLRNKLNTSPPPTPLPGLQSNGGIQGLGPSAPLTVTNPHSLSIDELPSPFPLSLTYTSTTPVALLSGSGAISSKRRTKTSGGLHTNQVGVGGLGKSIAMLTGAKENDVENDLGEIRRGNKRRRVAIGQAKHG